MPTSDDYRNFAQAQRRAAKAYLAAAERWEAIAAETEQAEKVRRIIPRGRTG